MALPGDSTKPRLTTRQGCRRMPDALVKVEDVLLAMCELDGVGKNIRGLCRMNKAIVVILCETDKLIEEGLVIMDSFGLIL